MQFKVLLFSPYPEESVKELKKVLPRFGQGK